MQMPLKDGKRKVLTLSYDNGNTQDIRLAEMFDGTFNVDTGLFLNDSSEREVNI